MSERHMIMIVLVIAVLAASVTLRWCLQEDARDAPPWPPAGTPADAALREPPPARTQLDGAQRSSAFAARAAQDEASSVDAAAGTSSLGLLVTATSGETLAGIALDVWQDGAQESVRVHTAADGRALVRGLAAGEARVSCNDVTNYEAPEPVTVQANGQEIVLVMRPTGPIQGVVLDQGGDPLIGVGVGRDTRSGLCRMVLSDAQGRFSIDAPLGEPVDVRLTGDREDSHDGSSFWLEFGTAHPHYRGELKGVVAPVTDLVLRAQRVAHDRTLQVIVHDGDGPVAGADVLIWVRLEPVLLKTDGSGRATFTGLPDEEVQVNAYPRSTGAPVFVAAESVRVVPAGQSIELRLRRGVTIAGVVLDADQRSVAGAAIEADAADEAPARAVSDAAGRFRLTVAPGRVYDVSASHAGDRTRSVTVRRVRPCGRDLVLRLARK
ncbi:MAG: carboxypeptidase regulatory-like domain-containing protein [Planctomycetota bacterium]